MNKTMRLAAAGIISFFLAAAAASVGTKDIRIFDTFIVFIHNLFNLPFTQKLYAEISAANAAIVWQLRLPRVLLAFLVGGSVSVSGAVFQSVLKNPLASPYMLGVSSGASLGAACVMLLGFSIPALGSLWSLPFAGFVFGLLTVFAVCTFSAKIDKSFSNNTVVLCGMVLSLFVNAVITVMMSIRSTELRTLIVWQMGSFAFRGWEHTRVMLLFFLLGAAGLFRRTKEMDLMSFGETEAKTAGLDAEKIKMRLFLFAAVLSGSAVALAGIIGFVDLIAPHLARRITGAVHAYMLPMTFLIGGSLMVVSDVIARTVAAPSELPVGAVTALIGAPFFAYIYFKKK
jgi:iron complex transport system permease protein